MLAVRFSNLTVIRKVSDGWSLVPNSTFDISGFIQPVSGSESFANLNLGQTITARLYCPMETDLRYGDKIDNYMVVYSYQPAGISGTGHHKEVLLSQAVEV